MDFSLTETQRILQLAVGEFADRWCPPDVVRRHDEGDIYPVEIYNELAKAGWLGILYPPKYGGAGGSAMDAALVFEELCKRWIALGLVYHTAAIFPLCILYFGSEEQKRTHLRDIAEGRTRFAFGLTEPNSGSDASALATRARREGDEFVINGTKTFISGADVANRIGLVARTDPDVSKHRGLSMFLLDTALPGVQIQPIAKMGIHGLRTCQIFLDNVRVPATDVVGKVNEGWQIVLRTLEVERLSIGARCCGGCQAVIDEAVRYVSQREQFGQPIGKFQAVQQMIADMETGTQAARLLTYRLAWMIDNSLPCAREAAVVKVFASETYARVSTMGVQLLGGYGYTMDFPMQRHFRDSKIFEIGGGTSQIQRGIIAKSLGL